MSNAASLRLVVLAAAFVLLVNVRLWFWSELAPLRPVVSYSVNHSLAVQVLDLFHGEFLELVQPADSRNNSDVFLAIDLSNQQAESFESIISSQEVSSAWLLLNLSWTRDYWNLDQEFLQPVSSNMIAWNRVGKNLPLVKTFPPSDLYWSKDSIVITHWIIVHSLLQGDRQVSDLSSGCRIKLNASMGVCFCDKSAWLPRGSSWSCMQMFKEPSSSNRSWEDLIPQKASNDGIVLLTAATFGYRMMVRNFYCNLVQLGHVSRFVLAAMDVQMYEWAARLGIPVYLETSGDYDAFMSASSDPVKFGRQEFKNLTKVKSRIVLRLLRFGYHVHWSDSDIVWFCDTTHQLRAWHRNLTLNSYSAALIVQSNEPDPFRSANNRMRINSGFYLAYSDIPTIRAFARIVEDARFSSESEQPSFYKVLCQKRIGRDSCRFGDLSIHFLDRFTYPNGRFLNVWNSTNMTFPINAVHNNWTPGKIFKKWNRLRRHNLVYFNESDVNLSCVSLKGRHVRSCSPMHQSKWDIT